MALGKLTEPETLSALSVRLLDTSVEVVQQTIICLVTISRMGKLYVEKLSFIGLDVTIVRLLSQSLSTIDADQTDVGSNIQRSIPFLLLELVKVMFTNAPSFARSKSDSIATMILQNSSKLVSHINVADFVCELLSITTVDSAGLCRQLYDGQLHETVKAALVVSPVTAATLCLDTLLSAILLNLLSCSDSDINETNASSLLPRLIERVSLQLSSLPPTAASAAVVTSTAMRVDDTATAARNVRTLDDNKVCDHTWIITISCMIEILFLSSSSYLTIYGIVSLLSPSHHLLSLTLIHTFSLVLSYSLSSPRQRQSQSSSRRSCCLRAYQEEELLTPRWVTSSRNILPRVLARRYPQQKQ